MTIVPTEIHRVNAIPVKIQTKCLQNLKFPKIYIEPQGSPDSQKNLKKEQSWKLRLPEFGNDYKSTVIKRVWVEHKDLRLGQWVEWKTRK